jgi:hypothetical protein
VQWNRISLFSGMINEMFFFSFFLSFSFGVLYLSVSTLSQSLTRRSKNRKEWCQKRKDKAQKKKKKKRSYLCPCLSRMKDETLREFDRLWRVCVCASSDEKDKAEIKRPPPLMLLLPPLSLNLPLASPSFLPSFLSVSVTALSLISFCFLSFGLYKRHLCAPLCVCVFSHGFDTCYMMGEIIIYTPSQATDAVKKSLFDCCRWSNILFYFIFKMCLRLLLEMNS